jgi:hypothetical protein
MAVAPGTPNPLSPAYVASGSSLPAERTRRPRHEDAGVYPGVPLILLSDSSAREAPSASAG